MKATLIFLFLSACGAEELDILGEWRNGDGDTLSLDGRDTDERIFGRFNQYTIRVREHAFGGFSLLFEEGQTVNGGGASTGFITDDGPSTFCRQCNLQPADEETPVDRMDCDTRPISVEQFGVQLTEAEFDCEWSRPSRVDSMREET